MIAGLQQWDVVRVRINPTDRDEHPAIVISPDEVLTDPNRTRINVLYGTTRRPGLTPRLHEVLLNGADGLEHPTVFSCAHFYRIDPTKIGGRFGRVAPERRRQIGRKIVAVYRLPL